MKEISVVGVIAQYYLCDMGGRHRPCGGPVSYVMLRAFRCFAFPVCVFCIGCCNAFMLFVCRFGSLWGIRFLYFFFIFRLNSHLQIVCCQPVQLEFNPEIQVSIHLSSFIACSHRYPILYSATTLPESVNTIISLILLVAEIAGARLAQIKGIC